MPADSPGRACRLPRDRECRLPRVVSDVDMRDKVVTEHGVRGRISALYQAKPALAA